MKRKCENFIILFNLNCRVFALKIYTTYLLFSVILFDTLSENFGCRLEFDIFVRN